MLNFKQPRLIAAALGTAALAVGATVVVFKGPAPKEMEPISVGRFSRPQQPGRGLGLGDPSVAERHQYTLTPPDADSTDMVRPSQWGPSASEEVSSTAQAAGAGGRMGEEGGGEDVPDAPADAAEDIPPAPGPAGSGFKAQDQDLAGKTGATSGASSSFSAPASVQPEGVLERLAAAAGQVFGKGKNIVRALGGSSRQATRSGQSGTLKKQSLATTAAGGGADAAAGSKSRVRGFGLEDEEGGPTKDGGNNEGGLPDCPAGMRPMMTGHGRNLWKCEPSGGLGKKDSDSGDNGASGVDEEDCRIQVGNGFYSAKVPRGTCKNINNNSNNDLGGENNNGSEDLAGSPEAGGAQDELLDNPLSEETPETSPDVVINNTNINMMTNSWSEAADVVKQGAVKNCQVVGGKSSCVGADNKTEEVSTEVAITEIRETAKARFNKEGTTYTDCKSTGGGKFSCTNSSTRKAEELDWKVWGAYVDNVAKSLAAANQKVQETCQSGSSSECKSAKLEQSNAQMKMDALTDSAQASRQQTTKSQTTTKTSSDKKNQGDTGGQSGQAVALVDASGKPAMNVTTDVCDASQGFYKIGSICQQVGTKPMASYPDKKSQTGVIFMTPAACAADKKYEFRVTNYPAAGHGECVLKKTLTSGSSTSSTSAGQTKNTGVSNTGSLSTQKTTTNNTAGSSTQKNSVSKRDNTWGSLNSGNSGGGFASKALGNNTTNKKESGGSETVTDFKKVTGKCFYAGQVRGKNTWTCPK